MLYQITDMAWTEEQLRRFDPGHVFLMRVHQRHQPDAPFMVLADDPREPRAVLTGRRGGFTLACAPAELPAVLGDLFHRRLTPEDAWPDAATREGWAEKGREGVGLSYTGLEMIDAARAAGFETDPAEDERHGVNFYYLTGEPRLSAHVKHFCRVVEGQELYALMRQGIDYDESGEYTEKCLASGPSFVCEITDESGRTIPVCWACTHLSGTLGMLYTPPEHRQRGYGRSLAAFQADYMLQTTGAAYCHVILGNEASTRNMQGLGAQCLGPFHWRTFYWP